MRGKNDIVEVLKRESIELTPTDATKAMTAWRAAFAVGVKAATGKWTHLGIDWHAFSYGFARCVDGKEAVRAYSSLPPVQGFLLIVGVGQRLRAYRSATGPLPRFSLLEAWNYGEARCVDLYLLALDDSWTLVLTHEVTHDHKAAYGPYWAQQ